MKYAYIFKIIILAIIINSRSVQLYSQFYGWTELNSGINTELKSVSIPANFINWVCGINGVVLRSTNDGNNWSNVSGNGIPNNGQLENIFGIDENNALTTGNIGSNAYVYKTTNGGANWLQVFSQAGGVVNSIWIGISNNGILVGNPVGGRWSIWKTTNGGTNWDSTGMYLPQNNTELGCRNSLFSNLASSKIWFGTNNSRIYYSTNAGISWIAQSTLSEQNSYSIFISNNNGFGFFGGSNLFQSTNYGNNWASVNSPGTGNINSMTGIGNGIPVFTRNSDSLFSNFYGLYKAPSGIYRNISVTRNGNGYGTFIAVRNNGGISRGYYGLEGISNISNDVPESFLLSQNYPNPFNPATSIKFSIVHAGLTYIKVFDSQGREVETLVSQIMNPGSYSVSFDASKLSSGVYFYRIISSGFTDTKKMVLIK